MSDIEQGTYIGIPCKVFQGAFPREAMVIIEAKGGEISGFVSRDELIQDDGDQGMLRALVVNVTDDAVSVSLRGSFFTTTGLADFSPDWAASNARVLAA